MLSPYCQQLIENLDLGGPPVPKLVPNLCNKTYYILHNRNLPEIYLDPGTKLTKIHQVVVLHRACG